MLGIQEDPPAPDVPAVPCRLTEIGNRCFPQALSNLVTLKSLAQIPAHQKRDGEFDACPAVVGIERQRPGEASDRFVETTEIAQAEGQIEEALAEIPLDRDRVIVMLHRLLEAAGGTQRIAEIRMQGGILGIGRKRQTVVGDRGVELSRQSQRHAEIVVQFGMVGARGEQAQVSGNRLVEPSRAMRLGGEAKLLDEAVGLGAEQGNRHAGGCRFRLRRMNDRPVGHVQCLSCSAHVDVAPTYISCRR